MDLSLWRHRSRIVAYIDIVLSCLGLFFTVLLLLLGTTATVYATGHKEEIKEELAKDKIEIQDKEITAIIWAVWVGIVIMTIIICIDLWAAISLLKATRIGADPVYAMSRAQIWRNVNIVFLIFSILFYGARLNFLSLVLELIFRGILLYIVCKFIEELFQTIGNARPSVPDNVVVKQ